MDLVQRYSKGSLFGAIVCLSLCSAQLRPVAIDGRVTTAAGKERVWHLDQVPKAQLSHRNCMKAPGRLSSPACYRLLARKESRSPGCKTRVNRPSL